MRISQIASLLLAAAPAARAASESSSASTTHLPACTALSSTGSGAYFDLRPDRAVSPDKSKSRGSAPTKDYHARGHDYGKNFTMNICGSVVEPVKDVVGLGKSQWANVSAYYTSHGDVYSIGSQSLDLVSRGRKIVLTYTGGSPCGASKKSGKNSREAATSQWDVGGMPGAASQHPHDIETIDSKSKSDDDDDDDKKTRRKSTTISFLCDHDPINTQATVSFVGTDPDECAYFFEARSFHACAQAEPHKPGSVGPGSIFGLILLIAVLVYVLGGVFYNRTVTHARGWRQLPNYSLWNGIWSFISDMFVIALSSCARFLPSRRGYSHLSSSPSRRDRNSEAENRLIDQLDEEWDD